MSGDIRANIEGRSCYLARIEGTAEGIWADKLGWFDEETDELVAETWFSGHSFELSPNSSTRVEDVSFEAVRVLEDEKDG